MGRIFGERLQAARLAAGFESQNELALASGVNQGALNKIEAGKKEAGPDYVAKLADALGLSVDDIQAWQVEDVASQLPPAHLALLIARLQGSLSSGPEGPPEPTDSGPEPDR